MTPGGWPESRSEAKRLIKQGWVRLNGVICYNPYPMVKIGDVISVGGKHRRAFRIVSNEEYDESIKENG